MRRAFFLVIVSILLLSSAGFGQTLKMKIPNPYDTLLYDDPIAPRESTTRLPPWFDFAGYFRLRTITAQGLDLGRGPTPTTGRTVVGTQPGVGGDFSGADMRLVLSPTLHLGPEVSLRSRFVFLDNLSLGSTPSAYPATANLPMPAGSTSQDTPRSGVNSLRDSVEINALWLEWLSPFGLFLAGRTSGDWGLGLVANSGNGIDADHFETVDRIGFVTSLFDTLIAVSYDFDANGGHGSFDNPMGSLHDLSDKDDLRTVNLALIHYDLPDVAARKITAGKWVFNWGVVFSYRWQDLDLPSYYFTPVDEWDGDVQAGEFVSRGIDAFLVDGWIRFASSQLLVEAEGAWVLSEMDSAGMVAGMETEAVTTNQWGGVLRARYRPGEGIVTVGLESGVASGDKAPGFGANPGAGYDPQPGDMDGAQLDFQGDTQVNNFRFNSNFHVDEILWRRIIGTVTDAVYLKPSVAVRPATWCSVDLSAIYSRTWNAVSAPGLARDLGVETDLSATFKLKDGLQFVAIGAMFFPMDGFRNLNTIPRQDPEMAWMLRGMAQVRF